MSKTIQGIPDYLTPEQYASIFEAVGIDPAACIEVRMAADGVHAVVFATDEHGRKIPWSGGRSGYREGDPLSPPPRAAGFQKHRIFIPVRRDDDRRTTRVRAITKD